MDVFRPLGGEDDDKSACQGDSGGGIYCKHKEAKIKVNSIP